MGVFTQVASNIKGFAHKFQMCLRVLCERGLTILLDNCLDALSNSYRRTFSNLSSQGLEAQMQGICSNITWNAQCFALFSKQRVCCLFKKRGNNNDIKERQSLNNELQFGMVWMELVTFSSNSLSHVQDTLLSVYKESLISLQARSLWICLFKLHVDEFEIDFDPGWICSQRVFSRNVAVKGFGLQMWTKSDMFKCACRKQLIIHLLILHSIDTIETANATEKIKDDIMAETLARSRLTRHIPPRRSSVEPFHIRLSVWVKDIFDISAHDSSLNVRYYFALHWEDERLRFEPFVENGTHISHLYVPIDIVKTSGTCKKHIGIHIFHQKLCKGPFTQDA